MELFFIAAAVGAVLFIVSFFFDGEELFGEAVVPPIAALFAFFGVTGLVTTSFGIFTPLLLTAISTAVGILAAAGSFFIYRAAHRLGDGKHNDIPPASALIGKKATVLWWGEGSGEVNLVVSGDLTRVSATGPVVLANGTEVFVTDAPTASSVVVTPAVASL